MLKLFDFFCPSCDHGFEALVSDGEQVPCPACGASQATKAPSIGRPFSLIKATTRTSRPYKAGYVHLAKRHREKTSVSVPVKLE